MLAGLPAVEKYGEAGNEIHLSINNIVRELNLKVPDRIILK